MDIVILLFKGFTSLDAIGPYEVLNRLPGAKVRFVAQQPGEVRNDVGSLGITADAALEDVTSADILLVPGGPGTRALLDDEPVKRWLRAIDATTKWTTSVCTGSLVLAAAGLLDGLQATTHWSAMDILAELGAKATAARVVFQGKRVTAAGVSAGIDMALSLMAKIAGDNMAQAVQLGIEYDPQPPFDSGSIAKASPHIRQIVESAMGG